jgi:transcriptional regulator NrdR family protein
MNKDGLSLIVKRFKHGRTFETEYFNPDKLQKSIVAACLSCGVPAGHADSIGSRIAAEVGDWLKDKPEVTSEDVRRTATHYLKTHHPDAAYIYEHHRSTL